MSEESTRKPYSAWTHDNWLWMFAGYAANPGEQTFQSLMKTMRRKNRKTIGFTWFKKQNAAYKRDPLRW
jgi:hypothetical protein